MEERDRRGNLGNSLPPDWQPSKTTTYPSPHTSFGDPTPVFHSIVCSYTSTIVVGLHHKPDQFVERKACF